jgi:hypothetical protein
MITLTYEDILEYGTPEELGIMTGILMKINVKPKGFKFDDGWYMRYSWTEEEQEEFKIALAQYFTDSDQKHKIPSIPWFILDYGWMTCRTK